MTVSCMFASAWCTAMSCASDCWTVTVADPWARPVKMVDEQLAGLRTLNANDTARLADVRRRQEALDADELAIVTALDARNRRIDGLLDERLRSAKQYDTVKA